MSTAAGVKILPYFEIARQYFPILDPDDDPIILPDTPAGSFGLAWCYGLTADGDPQFAVREDINVDQIKYIGFHEPGHAFNYTVARALADQQGITYQAATDLIRTRYWSFRGFPGLWEDAQALAVAGRRWDLYPDESFADAFMHALLLLHPFPGYVTGEWTANYGLPVNSGNALTFFQGLMQEVDDMFTQADRDMLARVKDLLEAREPLVWVAREQRGLDVEDGKPFVATRPPVDPRIVQ